LPDWPLTDRLPAEVDRLDVVDVLVGRDLLWKYRATIDLGHRVLRLHASDLEPRPEPRT
jgi:hypothetical protein